VAETYNCPRETRVLDLGQAPLRSDLRLAIGGDQDQLDRPARGAPLRRDDAYPDANTEFLFRFTTIILAAIPRTSLVAIVQWTPWADAKKNPFKGKEFSGGECAWADSEMVRPAEAR
jgi:hypothetical protein